MLESKVDQFDFQDPDTDDHYEVEARVVHNPSGQQPNFEIERVIKDGAEIKLDSMLPKLRHDLESHIRTKMEDRFYDPPEYVAP